MKECNNCIQHLGYSPKSMVYRKIGHIEFYYCPTCGNRELKEDKRTLIELLKEDGML